MAVLSGRLPRPVRPLRFDPFCSRSSSPASVRLQVRQRRTAGIVAERRCSVAPARAAASVISETATKQGVGLGSLVADVAAAAVQIFRRAVATRRTWRLQAEMLVERGIINCRFFALIAVAGSLLGSVLCFVEGSFLIIESYLEYFRSMSQRSDEREVLHLLIEAIDIFLVGFAMLVFGTGMYVLFVATKEVKREGLLIPQSNLFGLFQLKRLPSWVGMRSVSQAKSSIGKSVVMILQAGVLEKLKNIPMVSGLDLACFAGAVFLSSACIFLLSKLSMDEAKR